MLALHQERITHAFTNTDGLNIEEDVEHKVLENTLFSIRVIKRQTSN